MRRAIGDAAERLRQSILVRPLLFIVCGIGTAIILLGLDGLLGPAALPAWLRFDPEIARTLFATMAGAAITLAGLTFWVRASAVAMAASQYSPRVVQGFLHDWFQQSMMGLLVGIFAYLVVVLRAIPVDNGAAPQISVLIGILLTGGSVLAVLWAIRNGVESMQVGELARRITELTVERIRQRHPPLTSRRPARESRTVPDAPGHVIRATSSGWVQEIHEDRILAVVAEGAVVRLEVRVGLFVREGRALCNVWSDEGVWLDVDQRIRRAIHLGRTRTTRNDIHYGLAQLADIARGALTHGVADPSGAYEVIVHLDLILRELFAHELPPVSYVDDTGRRMIRRRDYSLEDYVRVAFDELRPAAAMHPTVAVAIIDTLGPLVAELEGSDRPEVAEPLRRQALLLLAACEQTELLADDLAQIHAAAARQALTDRTP